MTGRVNYTETRTKRLSGDPQELYVKDTFTYTNQDKLLTHIHKIGTTGTEQLLTKNTYDELGQLISKQVGGTDVINYTGIQKVDYTYNIRGWLKSINDVNQLQKSGAPKDLFAFKLNYNEVENATNYNGKSLFNGNIAETYWTTSTDDVKRKYGYFYDDLNRLTSAVYQKPNNAVPVTNSYNESLTYDKNGNIKTLVRTGEFDDAVYNLEIDNLIYYYDQNNKNRLIQVFDSSYNPNGFKDVADPVDYTYDANGNMISDKNKAIREITYNHLNLPTKIAFVSIGTIDYLYDAVGKKLRKIVTEGTSVITTDYLNGYQYNQTGATGTVVLDFFPHAEGYVKNTVVNNANVYSYVFNYTDHLGNIRLSYGLSNNVLTILEENNYYPFGLKHKNYNVTSKQYTQSGGAIGIEDCVNCSYKYKYNGKEYQNELGLNMYSMDIRLYDPAIARWIVQDPVVHHSFSPYNAFDNNPVYWADPSGADGEHYDWYLEKYVNDQYEEITFEEALESRNAAFYSLMSSNDASTSSDFRDSNSYQSGKSIDTGSEIASNFTRILQKPNRFGCSWACKKSTDLFFGKIAESKENDEWLKAVEKRGASIDEIIELYNRFGYNVKQLSNSNMDIHKGMFFGEEAIEWMANEIIKGNVVQIGWEPGFNENGQPIQHNSIITRVEYNYDTNKLKLSLMNPAKYESQDIQRLLNLTKIFRIYSVCPN
jgi:RHS repeat-associated protein